MFDGEYNLNAISESLRLLMVDVGMTVAMKVMDSNHQAVAIISFIRTVKILITMPLYVSAI